MLYSVIGASCLWPWNCLLIAGMFIQPYLKDYPSLQRSYSSYVMLAFTCTSLVLSTWLAMTPRSFGSRVRLGEGLIITGFTTLSLITYFKISSGLYFTLLILMVAIVSAGSSNIQNGSTAITQRIPGGHEARSVLVGQSFSGVAPPIFSIMLAVSSNHSNTQKGTSEPNTSTAIYLFSSSICLCAYVIWAFRGPTVEAQVQLSEEDESSPPSYRELWAVLEDLKTPVIAIFLCLASSLSYPVFANSVTSANISTKYFTPMTHLLWNSGDLFGRMICEMEEYRVNKSKNLRSYAFSRFAFIPALILYCWLGSPSDIIYLALMFGYGISNGHLLSSAISSAPQYVSEAQRSSAGGLIGMVIAFGLVAGSVVSFLVVPFLHV